MRPSAGVGGKNLRVGSGGFGPELIESLDRDVRDPIDITYRILRSWTIPRRSFVEMSSRRAASDALRTSSDIGSSLFNTEFTADELNLVLDLDQDGEVVSLDQNIWAILERGKQFDCFVEPEVDLLRWIEFRSFFHPARALSSSDACQNRRISRGCYKG